MSRLQGGRSGRGSGRDRVGVRVWHRWLAAGLLGVIGVIVPAAPAGAVGDPGGFFDGLIVYSSITNCVSIIQGAPYSEYGAGAYVGAYADPDEAPPVPGVGQTFYMHVVVYGLGNSCSGQYFVPAIDLPPGVSFDTGSPILCFTSQGQATSLSDCPQWGNTAASAYGGDLMYLSTDAAHAHTWPLPTGGFWEFRFPVTAAGQQTGTQLGGYVKMLDGNSSPTLHPTAPLYVFGASPAPAILYDAPSTVAGPFLPNSATPTHAGIYSVANYFTYGAGGQGTFQIGTSPGSYPQQVAFTLPAGTNSWQVSTDWDEVGISALVPGTTYYWRATFDPDGAAGIVYGAQQQFTMPAASTCGGQAITVALGLGQHPTEGSDVILGTAAAETISGGGGNDVICGLGGDDTLIGGPGNDTLIGGGGTDTASYVDATSGVTVNLGSAPQNTVGAGTDTLSSIENLTGSAFGDTLIGNGGANTITGGAGNDHLEGAGGNDTIFGGSGKDTLKGGGGKDVLVGGPGDDVLNGNKKADTASYAGAGSAVTVDLALTTSQNTGGAGSDKLKGIENLTGSSYGDTLRGSGKPNVLNGAAGTDFCDGRGGVDTAVSCETKVNIP